MSKLINRYDEIAGDLSGSIIISKEDSYKISEEIYNEMREFRLEFERKQFQSYIDTRDILIK